jgi:predicted permease
VRPYRWLLTLAPRWLREKHGLEMEAAFRAALDDSAQRGRWALMTTWLRAVMDILMASMREPHRRWTRRTRVGIVQERRSLMGGSDIRYAWRSLRRQKLGSALVVGMLALGIGANVAVFVLINGLFLRPFPFPDAERLVYINEAAPRWNLDMTGVNYPDFARWHKDQQAFEALALYDTLTLNVASEGGADRIDGARVTTDFAKVIGVNPVLGRLFTTEEDRPKGPDVVVIGYTLWQERFGGRSDVLDQTLRLNSRPFAVIGVLPREAEFPGGVRFWIPMRGDPDSPNQNYGSNGIGRMKAGVTAAQATQDLIRAHQPIFDARDKEKVVTPFARDLRQQFASEYRTIASTLSAAVSLLLLVACANVASVMLARALMRRREVGIRLAVGASRARLVRQLFAENIILSVLGGALGLVVGHWAIRFLVSAIPDEVPGWTTFVLDARTVVFTLGASVATALLFGWAPVLHAVRGDLRGAMSTAAAASTPPVRGSRTLRALVGAEFALAAVMLVCCGLLFRAYDRIRHVDPGFRPEGVLTLSVALPGTTYADGDKRLAFFERLEQRVAALPGVEHAGLITCAPLSNCHWGRLYNAEGQPRRGPNDPNPVVLNRVASPGYFPAMGIRLKQGRFFDASDGRDWPKKDGVVIVNETFARTLWPDGRSPIGQRVRWGTTDVPWVTVVGLVADVKHYGLEREMRPGVYLPLPMQSQQTLTLAMKTNGDPAQLAAPARAIIHELDPELPMFNVRTMEERVRRSLELRSVYSWMLGVFAAMALVLALGGSYGVTSYLVSQRTREIGIRVALGAARRDISRAVLGATLAVIGVGVLGGLALAVGAGRLLASLLFGVAPYDPLILISVTLALLAIAVMANLIPARRAARVDPMVSLRAE